MSTKPGAVTSNIFFQHIDSFIDYRKTVYEVSDQTIHSNRIDLTLFENFVKERDYIRIDGIAVMAFQFYLKEERNNSGPSINRKIFTLKSYSQFLKLVPVEFVENLPFNDILKVRGGYRNHPNALTKLQVKDFFDTIDRTTFIGIRDYTVYSLMYGLGLRVGEIHTLNLENIDFENKKITVIGKGKRRRTLHLTDEISDILSEWLATRKNFLNSQISNALFISKKGNRLAIRTMEENLKKILKKSNIKTHFNITCHTLRHSFASHLNDQDVDILVLQSLLGHSSPRSTQIYIHPSEQKVRAALEQLPGVIFMNQLLENGTLNFKFQSSNST